MPAAEEPEVEPEAGFPPVEGVDTLTAAVRPAELVDVLVRPAVELLVDIAFDGAELTAPAVPSAGGLLPPQAAYAPATTKASALFFALFISIPFAIHGAAHPRTSRASTAP
jgi:hypothetical protein